jgi:hypothetical protein
MDTESVVMEAQLYMILVSYYANMFQYFFRSSSGQCSKVRGTISVYCVLWDTMLLTGCT